MISRIFERYPPQIESELEALVRASSPELAPFYGMMHYHLGWADAQFRPSRQDTGKRLRPVLCLLAAKAAGGDPSRALPAAAALELLHNFSQIHDDIEDGDEERRHRTTVWRLWGIPQALNAGDGMMSLVYLAILRLGQAGVLAETTCAVMEAFSQMYRMLCEGQFLDIAFESYPVVSLEEYLAMIRRKTASLIATSCQIGAMLATQDRKTIQALQRFGENLGMAFQVVDDILGIWGEAQVTGKPVANDIRQRKKTLPIVHALADSGPLGRELGELYRGGDLGEKEVERVRQILAHLGSPGFCRERAGAFHSIAIKALEEAILPDEEAQAELIALADYLLARQY